MGTIASTMKFDQAGLGSLLTDKPLKVPVNQRSYKWETEHVEDLLQDFAQAVASSESDYFMGTVVFTQADGALEVADGQQRLATVTILLAAIRDYLAENGEHKRARVIENAYLESPDLRTEESVSKLTLNTDDNTYFKKRILSAHDSPDRNFAQTKPSHARIDNAAKLARAHIEKIVALHGQKNIVGNLLDWVEFAKDRARVIVVTVTDPASAFVIFETLNDRGLELSQADLLKNYLYGRAGDRIAEAQKNWTTMSGALDTVDEKGIELTYLRHLWISLRGPTRDRDLYARIRDTVKSKQRAIELSDDLAQGAMMYVAMLNPKHSHWAAMGHAMVRQVETLQLLRVGQIRPLMLAVARKFSDKEAIRAYRLFVSWSVRFLVVGGLGGGTMERNYGERALAVTEGRITTASGLAKSMADVVPTDATFEAAFATHTVSQTHLARYYLRALENQHGGDPEPELVANQDDVINLEHVLPQNPSTGWKHIDPDDAIALYKRIGNMVIMRARDNVLIGNESFATKRPVLKASAFKLTSMVANYEIWNEASISDRQLRLAALVPKTWPLSVR